MANPADLAFFRTDNGGLGGAVLVTQIANSDMISWTASTIGGVTITDVAAINAYDVASYPQGTLRFIVATASLQWKAPGGQFGLEVPITGDGVYTVYDGETDSKYIVLDVTAAGLPAGDVDQDITLGYLSNVLFDNVDADESEVGDVEYRGFVVKNIGLDIMTNVRAYIDTSDVPAQALLAGHDSSGAFYLDTGDVTEYPLNGFLENETTGEWYYYASKTQDNEKLVIPAVGRGARGTTPAAGSVDDVISYRAAISLGKDPVVGNAITEITAEDQAPVGVAFSYATQGAALTLGNLAPATPDVDGNKYGLWVERWVNPSSRPITDQKFSVRLSIDA